MLYLSCSRKHWSHHLTKDFFEITALYSLLAIALTNSCGAPCAPEVRPDVSHSELENMELCRVFSNQKSRQAAPGASVGRHPGRETGYGGYLTATGVVRPRARGGRQLGWVPSLARGGCSPSFIWGSRKVSPLPNAPGPAWAEREVLQGDPRRETEPAALTLHVPKRGVTKKISATRRSPAARAGRQGARLGAVPGVWRLLDSVHVGDPKSSHTPQLT